MTAIKSIEIYESEDSESSTVKDSSSSDSTNSILEIEIEMAPKLDRSFALKLIPEFDGNRANLHKFLNACDLISEDITAAEIPILLLIIKTKLTGPAYNIVKYTEFTTWESLKEKLMQQFLETKSLSQLQLELIHIKQRTNETVRSYSNRLEQTLANLNDACIASEGSESSSVILNLNSKTALKAFERGLNPKISLIIKASRFTSLTEAIEAAVLEEKSGFSYSNQTSYNPSQPKPRNPTHCNFCKKTGHSIEQCYLKKNKEQLPSFKSEVKKVTITCSYCKNLGHHINECRKREYNNNKKNNTNSNSPSTVNKHSENCSEAETSGRLRTQT